MLTEMSELNAMIAMGWGDTPYRRIPANWREIRGPLKGRPPGTTGPQETDEQRRARIDGRAGEMRAEARVQGRRKT